MDQLEPDVAVIPELRKPREHSDSGNFAWLGAAPAPGIGVIAKLPFTLEASPLNPGAPKMVRAFQVSGPQPIQLLAVWAHRERTYERTLHRALDHFGDFLRQGEPVIMGDFNTAAAYDAKYGRRDHLELVERLHGDFGLVSAYHAMRGEEHGAETAATHYWRWNEGQPFHIDYCFLPETWVPRLQRVDVGTFADWQSDSDHRPLIVELGIRAASASQETPL